MTGTSLCLLQGTGIQGKGHGSFAIPQGKTYLETNK